jgi:ATP-dependent metalloprotease FtsH
MFRKINPEETKKNLKLMMLSASVLIALFIYSLLKSDSIIQGGSYYVGIGFLLFLMVLAFYLQKYKEKIQHIIPSNKYQDNNFEESLENSKDISTNQYLHTNISAVVSNITFKDVAGISSVKEELEEVVDFLNNPKKYEKYNVNLPKGVLLVGPPGVGKTLIARAVAGEANVPFFYQSGASFVHIYVGMGAKRVKELFLSAKAQAPSIIFIDEIDAIGKSRGLGNNDERDSTLNELLTQMDGFDGNSGVMIIAATNKIEVLDGALLRAGRFDRRVFLKLPSLSDRKKIIELYTKNKNIDIDIDTLAINTSGFNSASIATLINEALLNMIKRNDTKIDEEDINNAKQKVQYGKQELNILCHEEKDTLATYQATKAFITKQKVSLFDEGIVSDDCLYPSKSKLILNIKHNLAGSIGLEVIKKEQYIVFESEIKKAYGIASMMKNDYKMVRDDKELIVTIKEELYKTIEDNLQEILNMKQTLIKEEQIVF